MIFGRTSEIDKFFAVACKWLAIGMIVSNIYFTYGYLQQRLGVGNADLKFIASVSVAVLVTCIESAVFTALFDPSVVGKLIARPSDVINSQDERVVAITGTAQNIALVGFCLLAALAFWFDFNGAIRY